MPRAQQGPIPWRSVSRLIAICAWRAPADSTIRAASTLGHNLDAIARLRLHVDFAVVHDRERRRIDEIFSLPGRDRLPRVTPAHHVEGDSIGPNIRRFGVAQLAERLQGRLNVAVDQIEFLFRSKA